MKRRASSKSGSLLLLLLLLLLLPAPPEWTVKRRGAKGGSEAMGLVLGYCCRPSRAAQKWLGSAPSSHAPTAHTRRGVGAGAADGAAVGACGVCGVCGVCALPSRRLVGGGSTTTCSPCALVHFFSPGE